MCMCHCMRATRPGLYRRRVYACSMVPAPWFCRTPRWKFTLRPEVSKTVVCGTRAHTHARTPFTRSLPRHPQIPCGPGTPLMDDDKLTHARAHKHTQREKEGSRDALVTCRTSATGSSAPMREKIFAPPLSTVMTMLPSPSASTLGEADHDSEACRPNNRVSAQRTVATVEVSMVVAICGFHPSLRK